VIRRVALLPLLAAPAGCGGLQTIGGREGRDAAIINDLFTIFCIVTALFFVAVMAFLFAAYWRRKGHRRDGMPDPLEVPARTGALRIALAVWTGAVVAGLVGLALASYFTDRSLAYPNPGNRPVVSIELIGNQWWWDVRYHFQDPSKNFRTANELHLPAGSPAMVYLKANDVIHSFWVPNLAGKQDLIPGRVNDIVLLPTKVGHYRGQCAEYCGLQHAHMALDVIVDSPQDFARWMESQSRPATTPATPRQIAGYDFFMNRQCSSCHAVAGTRAGAGVGPDLTHLMSRKTIAAGTLPNGTGPLHAWIADPQGVKPGTNMPYIGLNADELHNVVAYLESLK